MHPRSRYAVYLAYCAVTCIFHLNVTLFLSQHKGTPAHTLSYTLLFRYDIFQRLLLSKFTHNLHNKITLRWYHELRTRM